MLRVVFLGVSSTLSVRCLEAVAARHRVVAVVEGDPRPRRRLAGLRRVVARLRGRQPALPAAAARLGLPYQAARARDDRGLLRTLAARQPDLILIAGYPWILPESVFAAPRRGALNLHTSLLPRHRGSMPLYWLYQDDDREGGVTIHWVTSRADAGDIVLQEAFPLERGSPITQVFARCADLGGRLMAEALDAVERGDAPRRAQDDRLATPAPAVQPGGPIVRFDEWDVERVWHVLAGLLPLFRQPLRGPGGQAIRYDRVLGFDRAPHRCRPGTIEQSGQRFTLYCNGGIVTLDGAP